MVRVGCGEVHTNDNTHILRDKGNCGANDHDIVSSNPFNQAQSRENPQPNAKNCDAKECRGDYHQLWAFVVCG